MKPDLFLFFRITDKGLSRCLYFILGFLAFALAINFSKDWNNYLFWNQFYAKKYDAIGFQYLINPLQEPLYKLLSIHISRWIEFSGFVLLATISLLYLKLRSLEAILDNPYTGTFFYVCTYLLLFEGTAIRAGFAVALIIPALLFLKNSRYVYAVGLVLLAGLIHLSAWVFLLIFPLYLYRKSELIAYGFLLISIFVALFGVEVFDLIQDYMAAINPRYLDYGASFKLNGQNSTGLYFYFIAFYAALLAVIYSYLKPKLEGDRFAKSIYLGAVTGVAFMLLFHSHVALGARLGELLLVPVVILLAWLDDLFYTKHMKVHRIALYSIFFAYFLARLFYLYPTAFPSMG